MMFAYISCPHCGELNNDHSPAIAKTLQPSDGDASICWSCKKPAIFTIGLLGQLTLRVPTPAEQTDIENDPAYRRVMAATAESYTAEQALGLLPGLIGAAGQASG